MLEKFALKIGIYALIALVVTGGLGAIYYTWKKNIEREAEQRLVVRQLESAVNELQVSIQQMESVRKETEAVRRDLLVRLDQIRRESELIIEEVIEPAEDRESSQVLKDTVQRLRRGN